MVCAFCPGSKIARVPVQVLPPSVVLENQVGPRNAREWRMASTLWLGATSRSHTTYAVPPWTGSAVTDSLSLKKWVNSKMAVVPWSDLIRFGLTQVLPPSLEVTAATPVSLLPAPPLAV